MRRILLNLSLLALVAAPLAAHAASTDLLTLTETSGGTNVYTFLLPAIPTPSSVTALSPDAFTLSSIPVTTNGAAPTLDTVGFADAVDSGGFYDFNLADGFYTPVLFTGPATAPVFQISSGTGVHDYGTGIYSYSLVASTASPTPEPSSLILLGTGAAGLFGSFRRRFVS